MEFTVSIDIKGKPVAVGSILGESSADARFTYAADYLHATDAVPISLSLPLQDLSQSATSVGAVLCRTNQMLF